MFGVDALAFLGALVATIGDIIEVLTTEPIVYFLYLTMVGIVIGMVKGFLRTMKG